MKETPLAITVDEQHSLVVVRVTGDVAASQAGSIEDTVLPHVSSAGVDVHVDLSGMTFLSSTGLAVFVQLMRRAKQAKRTLRFTNPSPHIERMLRIANLPVGG